jgi:cytochrome c oxidase subunit II
MPRRTVVVLSLALVLALVWAAAGLAAPGGIGPPAPRTDSGKAIDELYWVVFTICAIVFVAVETALVLFIIRFRRRRGTPEDAEGPQIHGNTRLEIIWTIAPALVLAGIAIYTLARIPAVEAKGSDELVVRVESHQFYWQYVYPNGAVSLDELTLPVDRTVRLELTTWDVNHSWWVPPLTGKKDAIAGQVNVLRFKPEETGTWEGQCAELCGIQHAVMYTQVHVVEQAAFDAWLDDQAAISDEDLGRQEWEAVCAKCHGMEGEGGVGPPVTGNGTLRNRQALIRLLSTGQNTPQLPGYMPPVGRGWNGKQYDALVAYVNATPSLSGAQEGTQSGR